VEGAVEDEDAAPARGGARDLDRVLDRLGARVDEDRLRRGLARPELVELLGHVDVALVGADHEALVQVAVDLLVDRPHDRRVPVPEVLAGDAAGEVEVLPAFRVPDPRAPGAGDHEVGARDAPRHEALACLLHALGGDPVLEPHRLGVSH
jgi:hypothetical protein